MTIYLASDHRGFELKETIKEWLSEWKFDYKDMGPDKLDPDDDYPDFVSLAARAVSDDPDNARGIVLGYSGQGEAVVANKFKGVRAVVYYGDATALEPEKPGNIIELSRRDDDANVLSIGAGFVGGDNLKAATKIWLDTEFKGEERHNRRIDKIKALEL
jgi:ribose 5-phosphate isomerase B